LNIFPHQRQQFHFPTLRLRQRRIHHGIHNFWNIVNQQNASPGPCRMAP
jgi:hypothetical protein